MWNLEMVLLACLLSHFIDDLICKTEIETQAQRINDGHQGGKGGWDEFGDQD